MNDLRTAAQQALEALKTGGWNMTTRAIADLERALAQQAEPQGCATEEDCTKLPWCRIRGECQRKQAEPVERAMQDAVTTGMGIMRGGERIDPSTIYKPIEGVPV